MDDYFGHQHPSSHYKVQLYFILIFDVGTNVSAGKKLLEESGLLIQFASNLDEAAKKAILSLEK